MPEEIEAKQAVADLSPVAAALDAARASRLGSVLETDRFFDTPDRRLYRSDSALRLRQRADLADVAAAPAGGMLTFKGPRRCEPGGLKVRHEVQSLVDDVAALAEILTACGLRAWVTLQKRRRSYRLDDCSVELDELPMLGCFVEVEGPSAGAIHAVRRRLGLAGETITRSYLAMAAERCGGLDECGTFTFAACEACPRRPG